MKTVWLIFIPLAVVQFIIRFICLLAILILLTRCTEEEIPGNGADPASVVEGSWITFSPYKWAHDGTPYHVEYCTIFSDGASTELKKTAGILADDKFLGILGMFSFSDLDDLIYPTDRKTIDVYINTNHPENIAAAYWGSIFITVRATELDSARYAYLFKHELTHVFEFLVEGTVNLAADMWFTEGIAIYCGGLNRIKTTEEIEQWIAKNEQSPNKGNPITIRRWEDYPAGADKPGYTTVFEIVMKYLLDPEGLNHSIEDVLNVFYDLRELKPFNESFENNFGITVDTLEAEIFDRLIYYLNLKNNRFK